MSTYNSKFSGAEIDALLEKVASGQVGGGGGGSEKEPVLKELGATHKHLCKLGFSPADGVTVVGWVYLYNNITEAYTLDTLGNYLTESQTLLNGYMVYVMNGQMGACGDIKIGCVADDSSMFVGIMLPTGLYGQKIITNVDFGNQNATEGVITLMGYETLPLSNMASLNGFTFTDDVTEL